MRNVCVVHHSQKWPSKQSSDFLHALILTFRLWSCILSISIFLRLLPVIVSSHVVWTLTWDIECCMICGVYFTFLSAINNWNYTSGTLAESWHNISVFLSLEHFRSAVRSRRTMAVCLHCVSWGMALYWLEEVKTTRSSCGTMTSTQRETLRCATRRTYWHHRHVKIVSIQRRIYD